MYMPDHKCMCARMRAPPPTYIQTQNKLASWLVLPADCCGDTIFSLVPVTVTILTHMHEETRLSQDVSFIVATSVTKVGWPLLKMCYCLATMQKATWD